MAFRDTLLPASFRGITFGVRGASADWGRKIVEHEYPGRATPWAEDLGRKGRTFSLQGFVLGDDVVRQIEALRAAAETRGPGTLVHPWLGSIEVTCLRLRTSETASEGRQSTIEFEFVEAGEQLFPASIPEPGSSADAVAEQSRAAAVAAFLARVKGDALDVADFVRDGLDRGVGLAVDGLRALTVARGTDPAGELSARIGQLARLVGGFGNGTASSTSVAQQIADVVATVPLASGGGVVGLRSLEALAGSTLPTVTALSAEGRQAQENARAVVSLMREMSLAELVRAAASIQWESYEAALAWRDRILALLEAQLAEATDEAFESLRDLIAELTQSVPPPFEELPQLARVELRQTTPAAVVAYELFGSGERGDAIATRNRVRHPSFVPGGQPLEVLIP